MWYRRYINHRMGKIWEAIHYSQINRLHNNNLDNSNNDNSNSNSNECGHSQSDHIDDRCGSEHSPLPSTSDETAVAMIRANSTIDLQQTVYTAEEVGEIRLSTTISWSLMLRQLYNATYLSEEARILCRQTNFSRYW